MGDWFGISNPWGGASFTSLTSIVDKVSYIASGVVTLSALVAVGLIVYGAFNLITSAGSDEKVEKGTKVIQAAIIGMVIVFLARLIVVFIVDKLF